MTNKDNLVSKDTALKMAIEAMENIHSESEPNDWHWNKLNKAINACKEALDTEQVREDLPAQDDDLMSGKWVRFNEDDDTSRLLMELEVAMNGVENSAKSPAVIDVLRQAVNYFKKGKKYHVLPIDDVEPHEESEQCKCNPTIEIYENNKVVIHNSFDGREALDTEQVREDLPAQEPVGIIISENDYHAVSFDKRMGRVFWFISFDEYKNGAKLYTHPHQWQGLTDDEIVEFACEYGLGTDMPKSEEYPLGILWYDGNRMEFARAIEQALKDKNHA